MIFTVGHSSVAFDHFVSLVRAYQVETIVDVRSYPVSGFAPHFSRRRLATGLRGSGVRYAFMGDALGGRPGNPQFYDEHGRVLYGEWSESAPFKAGLYKLTRAATRQRIAVMCSEESPLQCHRHLLIARALANGGWPRGRIVHIRGDGLCMPEEMIALQSGPFMEGIGWRSPRSVSREPRLSTSSSD